MVVGKGLISTNFNYPRPTTNDALCSRRLGLSKLWAREIFSDKLYPGTFFDQVRHERGARH